MEPDSPYQIQITSYEINNGTMRPVLSHIFYGQTPEEAQGYARSHLLTDYFFSSSFVGKMNWQGSVLVLNNQGMLLSRYTPPNDTESRLIMTELAEGATQINRDQNRLGMLLLIQDVARMN